MRVSSHGKRRFDYLFRSLPDDVPCNQSRNVHPAWRRNQERPEDKTAKAPTRADCPNCAKSISLPSSTLRYIQAANMSGASGCDAIYEDAVKPPGLRTNGAQRDREIRFACIIPHTI